MNIYISSKQIISQVVSLTLLLSTTHFALVHPVLAGFEETIDLEEKIPAVKPEDLSQDFTEIQKIVAETETYKKGIHTWERVQNTIDDFTHLDDIKRQRDEAIDSAKKSAERISQLENALSKQRTKIDHKKSQISQLETYLTSLANEKNTLVAENDQNKIEIEQLQSKLKEAKLELQQFTEDIKNQITNIQKEAIESDKVWERREQQIIDRYQQERKTLDEKHRAEITKINNAIAEKEQLLHSKEERITQLSQALTVGQKDYNAMQEDIKALKENYEQEKKALDEGHRAEITKINNAIAEKEQLLHSKEERITQLSQALTVGQKDYNAMQEDIKALKENYEQEKKALDEGHRAEITKINNAIAEKEQLLSNQTQIIDKLGQDQYNRAEQDRDWSDIRSYFEQKEVNQIKDELSKESAIKIEQLAQEHQAEKRLLEEQINSLQQEYHLILTQNDKNLANITQDLTRRLNVAEALSQKSAQDLVNTQSELTKITQENSKRELIIASLEKKLMKNARKLADSLNVNEQSSDKIKELENDKSSLEDKYNLLLSEQNQNLLQIQELEAKLLSEQAKHNNYTQQIAQLTTQNQIAKESLAKQILLQGKAMEITEDNYRQDLEIFSQSRDLELNDASSIPSNEINQQTVDVVKAMASVMANSIEAASGQLYANISSRFNNNDHISSGDARGQIEIWVKQGASIMNQKPTDASGEGYKGRSHGLFIGIDHQCELGDKNLIGAAITLNNKSKMQLRSTHAQLITDSNILSVYGRRYLNSRFAVSGAFSYFRATTEDNNFGENIDKIKTHGTKFDLELSYNKLVRGDQSWQPFVGVSYGSTSAFDMNFKDQGVIVKMKKSRLLSGKIGTRVQLKQYNLENGINISPSLMASISKPLKIISGNRCIVNNSILSDTNNTLLTHKIKDATLNLGGDLRINRNNIDIIASYNFNMRKKYQAHQCGIKLEVKL